MPRLNLHVPAFLSASMSVWLVKTQQKSQREWSGLAQIAVQVKGRSLNNPSPFRPCRCHSRGSFPHLTSVRNSSGIFSRIFPEIFRNISSIFRYFVGPLFIGFRDPPSFFVTFFEHLSLLSERFSETFSNIFRYISGIFRDTFGPVPVTRSDHCLTIPGTLVAEPQPLVFQLGAFHQCSVGPPQNKRQ